MKEYMAQFLLGGQKCRKLKLSNLEDLDCAENLPPNIPSGP